jgi:hypothetical protein
VASHRRRRTRTRASAPLDIRRWVIEIPTEELYDELDRRVAALQQVGERSADIFLEGGKRLASLTQGLLGHSSDLRAPTADERELLIRACGADVVAGHWRQREYRPKTLLPPIMTAGVPWATLPDHIHVLDLSPQRIRAAMPKKSELRALASAQRNLTSADNVHFLLAASHRIIGQLGPRALFSPIVLLALFYWLSIARYASRSDEAQYAASVADTLLDAFRPNLSLRRSRTPDRLLETQEQFRTLLIRSRQLKHMQRSQDPLPVILAKARDWLGGRVDRRDLERWRGMSAEAVATELLKEAYRGRWRISEKSLRDYRRLAAQSQDVDEAWLAFTEHLKQRSDADQRRIITALPPILFPLAPQDVTPP